MSAAAKGRRVLIVPSWYPSAARPLTGSFFREQAHVLMPEWDVRVLVPCGQSTRLYWRGQALAAEAQPLQDPPAFAARYRTDKWMKWGRLQDAIAAAVSRSLSEFERGGWVADVVLAHSTAWAGVTAARVARRLGLPLVIVEHNCPWLLNRYTPEQQAAVFDALAAATTVCAVSPALRRLMLAHALSDSIHWEIVGNLVDEAVFSPAASGALASGAARDDYPILTVASRQPAKDVGTLFRAAALLRRQRPQLRFTVRAVGDSLVDGPSFADLATDAGVADIVAVDGALDRPAVMHAMRDADLFVSSSIAETFGIVMAEALACGTPVVATRSGGAEYILGEGSPLLVEPREPEALAATIAQVVDGVVAFDPAAASRDIVERFGSRVFAARMTRVLNEAISRGR
jgi:glycosyltransferase involved in cell wall biosynthesis